jgi:hypothetical protein
VEVVVFAEREHVRLEHDGVGWPAHAEMQGLEELYLGCLFWWSIWNGSRGRKAVRRLELDRYGILVQEAKQGSNFVYSELE